jgi:hypothetical protein
MKRIALQLSVALLSFSIGVMATMVCSRFRVLPYCEVARNAEQYQGKVVRVKARLIFGSDGMYIYEDCDPISALATLVEWEGSKSTIVGIGNYVEEVLVIGEKEPIKTVEAIITGCFDSEYSTGCWAPQFHIAATSIEATSPVSDYKVVSSNAPETRPLDAKKSQW